MQTLFDFLKQLELPDGDYAVFGSGPMIVRGIILPTNDLDVICRRAAWSRVKAIGTLQFSDDYGVEIVALFDGRVTFGNKWGIGDFDVNELIDSAEYIGELPFVKLEHIVSCKMQCGSEKDGRHIDLLTRSEYSSALENGA